jgi:hypothetical protein
VTQPTCGYILKKDYVDYIGGADAELVASKTMDVAEYLWEKVHKGEGTELDNEFGGEVPATTTYHAARHLRRTSGSRAATVSSSPAPSSRSSPSARHRRHVGPARRELRDPRACQEDGRCHPEGRQRVDRR